jgi:hypothetical protein
MLLSIALSLILNTAFRRLGCFLLREESIQIGAMKIVQFGDRVYLSRFHLKIDTQCSPETPCFK